MSCAVPARSGSAAPPGVEPLPPGQAMLGRHGPLWLGDAAMGAAARSLERDPEAALQRLFRDLPEADRTVLGVAEVRDGYLAAMREGFRAGPRGVALDCRLSMRDWGVDLAQISIPVQWGHGEADTVTPLVVGRYLARALPGYDAHVLPAAGHFSLVPDHAAGTHVTVAPSQAGADGAARPGGQ